MAAIHERFRAGDGAERHPEQAPHGLPPSPARGLGVAAAHRAALAAIEMANLWRALRTEET